MEEKTNLKKKTISGLFWSFANVVANQGIQFIIQIFLARLLLPSDFGIIGMITVFIAVSQSIVDSGFSNALIREKNSTQEDYSTVFYFNLVMSLFLYILLYVLAVPISDFFNEPKIVSILRVLSLVIIINSFGLIQRTILTKQINFKIQTKISVISSILSGIVAVFFAYSGFGIWSLVIGTLGLNFIQSLLLCLSNRWIPSLTFSMDSFKRLFGFGSKLLVSGLIDTIYKNIYYVIIGRFFSASELGYYTNAQKFRDGVSQSLTISIQKVSYPVLSSISDNEELLRSMYQKIIKNTVFVTFPLMTGLLVIADPLIPLLFGEKWVPSIPYFQVLCLSGMLYPLHAINLNMLQVKGRSDLFLHLEIIKKIIGLTSIFLVLFFKLGIMGLLWALVVVSVISYFMNSYYSGKLIKYSSSMQIRDIFPVFLISVVTGALVFMFGIVVDNRVIDIFIKLAIFGLIYIILSRFFKIQGLNDIKELTSFIKKH
ncbi:lipopolysaccharide biosynthesis protein [Methanococcus maripaludis]|uniref:O-antigen/teichoic acid export membrane protein n=1 Tax=Methanococcus maripaludis TaxID=39152 RepID=A0A7J9PCQ7_METMI|nr:lipopolysaccharide biosynthesis protein [Methanococcus maripaludis]MBA2860457.1 O-antigen/teichoic acid export membrane protein [Methanococcus maripaludis]